MESSPKHKNKKQRTESTKGTMIRTIVSTKTGNKEIRYFDSEKDLIKELDNLNLPQIDANKLIQFTGGDKVKASSLMQNK